MNSRPRRIRRVGIGIVLVVALGRVEVKNS